MSGYRALLMLAAGIAFTGSVVADYLVVYAIVLYADKGPISGLAGDMALLIGFGFGLLSGIALYTIAFRVSGKSRTMLVAGIVLQSAILAFGLVSRVLDNMQ